MKSCCRGGGLPKPSHLGPVLLFCFAFRAGPGPGHAGCGQLSGVVHSRSCSRGRMNLGPFPSSRQAWKRLRVQIPLPEEQRVFLLRRGPWGRGRGWERSQPADPGELLLRAAWWQLRSEGRTPQQALSAPPDPETQPGCSGSPGALPAAPVSSGPARC